MEFSMNLLKNALIHIFERDNERKLTVSERKEFEETFESMGKEVDIAEIPLDDECEQILLENKIEKTANAIRMIVAWIVNAINENSSYYEVKRDIPLIKECHSKVMSYVHTDLFPKIVDYAKEDMFYGDMRILSDQTPYLKFFSEYTNYPEHFSILILKDRAPRKLVEYLEKNQVFDP